MFARFNENPAMTLQDIKETKRYGRTDGRTDNVKTVYPLQTKFAGGIMNPNISCFENTVEHQKPSDQDPQFSKHDISRFSKTRVSP